LLFDPPITLFGLVLNVSGWAALMVKTAVAVFPLCVAVIVDVVFAPTLTVVTVNVAVVAPARTVTEEGTVALLPVAESETTKPPAGAADPRVIVPVELAGPITVVGLSAIAIAGTVTVKTALAPPLPAAALIMLVVDVPTPSVVTVNVVLVVPAGTVTVPGTVAALVLLEVKLTVIPPVGAALVNVTVPVEEVPPTTVVGLSETVLTPGGVTVRVAT